MIPARTCTCKPDVKNSTVKPPWPTPVRVMPWVTVQIWAVFRISKNWSRRLCVNCSPRTSCRIFLRSCPSPSRDYPHSNLHKTCRISTPTWVFCSPCPRLTARIFSLLPRRTSTPPLTPTASSIWSHSSARPGRQSARISLSPLQLSSPTVADKKARRMPRRVPRPRLQL